MTQRDEEQLVDARKAFYENATVNTEIVPKLQFVGKFLFSKEFFLNINLF